MKKFCKVIISFFACITFLFSTASATLVSSTYKIPALDLSLEIPSNYYIITRETETSSSVWDIVGLTQSDMLAFMNTNHLYMDLIDKNYDHEITVSMEENSLSNFKELHRSGLEFLASAFVSSFPEYGMTVSRTAIYEQEQANFIKIYYSIPNDNNITHVLQYYTVYDYKAINFRLFSFSGEITSIHETIMQSLIDNLDFEGFPQPTSTTKPSTSGYTYHDPESNAFFFLPDNWIEKPLSKQREVVDAKFSSYDDPGITVMFSSTDLWANGWTESERVRIENQGVTRYDLDFDVADVLFDLPSLVSEMSDASLSIEEAEKTQHGSHKYYVFETISHNSALGFELNTKMTVALTIEDGYFYMFYFSSTNENPLYSDYESILASLDFE